MAVGTWLAGFLIMLLAIPAAPVAAWRPHLLPSQQRVQPVGKQINLGLFPTGVALSPDGRRLLATNNGFLFQSLTAVETATLHATDQQLGSPGGNILFIGVALSPDGSTGYASGHLEFGAQDVVHTVSLGPGSTIAVTDPIMFPLGSFPAGMAINSDGSRLYVAENLADALAVVDTATKTIVATIPVGRLPWGVALHPSLPQVYVTNRADRTVSVVNIEMMSAPTVRTGAGPNAVAVSPDGAKVFVANASSDDLTVFDVNQLQSVRTISLTPFPGARPGSSPNGLAFSPNGKRLYVANAWDNAVVVVDPSTETVKGLIPTGWYPTAIAVSPDNRTLYVTNMKGGRTYPRTRPRQTLDFTVNQRFGGTYGVRGTLQVLRVPSVSELQELTRKVRYNNGFDAGMRPSNATAPAGPCYPIPCRDGDPTPIKHVVFIVRENKTYDQELGDVLEGDGEPKFVLFGATVTPNLHKLVSEFVLLDRFFANSEKSECGHQWTTAAIDSDYVEKTWTSTTYEGRPDDIAVHNDRGSVYPVAYPAGLYWFDNCHDHGVTFRNYGEFQRVDESGQQIDYWVANTDFNYRRFDLDYPDQQRVDEWKTEFDEQVRTDTFPQFTYMAIPNDHTKGTMPDVPDPRSFVADNDLATGRVVEAISNSRYWGETAIFILEDDPQSGADHIDSHRTVGTVVSPWVRRHSVSHTRYDMASMHRTMELILGLPPMSQFDQLAIPMRELFTDTPDTTPFSTVPAQIPFMLVRRDAPGADRSARQDWRRPDRVPDELLNQLLWDYLKGERLR